MSSTCFGLFRSPSSLEHATRWLPHYAPPLCSRDSHVELNSIFPHSTSMGLGRPLGFCMWDTRCGGMAGTLIVIAGYKVEAFRTITTECERALALAGGGRRAAGVRHALPATITPVTPPPRCRLSSTTC
ncbi:hypothetical protein MSG28_000627 [Choristoneura fumiferana]|uniref:Uncharacterized protein n=1 Tax=Choristoneura fumiferana TaxID=7141 RepID=A0ACC0K1S3_CHOFU|nr:hypothetical protein MSG28_000627 [Choristoneura fumiferana]